MQVRDGTGGRPIIAKSKSAAGAALAYARHLGPAESHKQAAAAERAMAAGSCAQNHTSLLATRSLPRPGDACFACGKDPVTNKLAFFRAQVMSVKDGQRPLVKVKYTATLKARRGQMAPHLPLCGTATLDLSHVRPHLWGGRAVP